MIKIDGGMNRFIFLVSDVSIFSVYSPLQMLFFRPMYLQDFNIHYCRCSFGDQRICNLLFFELADAFQPVYYINCIYILPFLGFEDTAFANFASTSHIFDNMRMFLIEILHPLLALSMPCGCSPVKFCIFNPLKSTIADIIAQHPLLLFTSQLEPIHYLQKN